MDYEQPPQPEKIPSVLDDDFYLKHFLPEDQKRMHSRTWDYTDEHAQLNKWRKELEGLDESTLTTKQIQDRNSALWMWYHHASQFAHQAGDPSLALEYIDKALHYRDTTGSHTPNQITPLLKMLYQGNYDDARAFIDNEIPETIYDHDGNEYTNERPNVEKETANNLLAHFRKHYPLS